jgi:flagellar basal-body rod modification protein FlgD
VETSAVTGYGSHNAVSEAVNKNILGKDDFFKLLITELKYQDPLEPMKDREFIAQMANFSALEQMQNMNQNLENVIGYLADFTGLLGSSMVMQQAVSLIGKQVEFAGEEEDELQQGIVESVIMENGVPYLNIAGNKVALEQLLAVRMPVVEENEPAAEDLEETQVVNEETAAAIDDEMDTGEHGVGVEDDHTISDTAAAISGSEDNSGEEGGNE